MSIGRKDRRAHLTSRRAKCALIAPVGALLLVLAGCSGGRDLPEASTAPSHAVPSPTADVAEGSVSPTPETSEDPGASVTRLRFSVADQEIVVRTADNPTSRDLVSMLPLTLEFEDFAGFEKISYLPEALTTEGSQGSAAANGDLIYYVPWGNLGFFYNAEGGYSDEVIMVGTIESGYELVDRLEDGPVSVEVVS